MSGPLRSLMPSVWPVLVLLALFQGVFIFDLFFSPQPPRESFILVHISITALMPVVYVLPRRSAWRLYRRARRFAPVENSRIVLHYDPKLKTSQNLSDFLQSCEEELDNLTQWFGSPLRGRLTVYLFAHWRDISAIFGSGYVAWAIFQTKTIVLAGDNRIPELMRHELAHLFSFRWSVHAPLLLSEGLSVWSQETVYGRPIDAAAIPLLRQGSPSLRMLLRSKYFLAEANRQSCYIMAGSFTGYLIRRYGWNRYRKLYRSCDGLRFAAKFQKCFGVSLEKADWQWRNELMVMPILNRRMGRNSSY